MKPAALYESFKMNAGDSADDQRFKCPTNKQQIKRLQKNFRKVAGRDDIQTILFGLAQTYRSFQFYVVSPRLVLVLSEPEMIEYSRDLLKSVSWKAGADEQRLRF